MTSGVYMIFASVRAEVLGQLTMIDWSRTGSIFDLAVWFVLCGLWWSGGCFLAWSLFRLRAREILFAGFSIGMLLFIVFSNLFAHFLRLEFSFWISSILIFLCGLVFRIQHKPTTIHPRCGFWCQAGQVAAFLILLTFFVKVNIGLSIFDDNNNLPLVSRLSAGDFPPHFYLNPEQRLDYHYGLHLFAASLVRIAGFYPWSALDFSKAITLSTLAILTWLWFRRQVRPGLVTVFALIFIFLATGTRWLLLFVPETYLVNLSAHIQLTGSALNSGPELSQALVNPWIIEGSSPVDFPFAFSNGIVPPVILAMTGYGALPYLTAVLLLLMRKAAATSQKFVAGLVFSSLAITGEHLFLMVWTGILLAVLVHWLATRPTRNSLSMAVRWGWFLVPSLVIASFGGGVLSESLNRFLMPPTPSSISGVGFGGVSLRLPPGITSAHLGNLSLFEPVQLVVAMMEIGLLVLLTIPVFYASAKRIKKDDILFTGLALAAAIGLIIPLVFQLTLRDRDISRMSGMALFLLMVLGFPLVVLIWKKAGVVLKTFLVCGYAVSIIGGIAMLPSILVASARPQSSYFISQLDRQAAKMYWNTLEWDAAIFDPAYTYRPAAIFASSAGQAYQDIHTPYPGFAALTANPNPLQAADQGYMYYYLDRQTWDKFPPEIQAAFSNACVKGIAQFTSDDGDFRKLYDLRACQG